MPKVYNAMNNKKESVKFKTTYSMLLYFLKGSKLFFILGILFTCALSFVELINPKVIGVTIDGIINHDTKITSNLIYIALFVVVVALIGALFRYLYGLMNSKGGERLVKNMRDGLYEHILYLPYAWMGENKTGDIIQRCTSDVDTIKRFIAEELTTLLRTIVMITFALIFMLNIDIKLTLVSFIFIPIMVGYSLIFHKKIGSAFYKVDIEEGVLSSIAQENLTGVRVVRAFGQEAYEKDRFMKQNEHYTNMWVHMMQILSQFWASTDLISGVQILSVLAIGAYFTVDGNITAGAYISFVAYNAMLTWPVRNLGRIIADMSKAGISIDRIRYIMNSTLEMDEEDTYFYPECNDIDFQNVTFSYDGENNVLDNINLHIKEGTTVGILGKTGSGKSTLVHLLDRLYTLSEGEGSIKIGGVDIRNLRKDEIRKNIGLVLQEPFLFSRTLGENIAITIDDEIKDENIIKAKVDEASKMAHLDKAIQKFNQGYDTLVGERGVTLSGGQKQRTAIASTLIRKTPIMIFDDSMSAVDTKTDEAIRKSIKEYTNDTTVILISHRITTLMMADNIIVLDKGKIVEEGSHDELINKNGLYKKIYDLQINAKED